MKTYQCYWCVNAFGHVIENAYFTDTEVFRKACADLRADKKVFEIKTGRIRIIETALEYLEIR